MKDANQYPGEAADKFLSVHGMKLLVVLALAVLLPGTATLPLIDRDEPRFGQATVEMIQGGHWLIPYFNGEYRFDKPVLTYWLMRAGYAIFGIGEFGSRVHSVVATTLLALVVFAFGRKLFRPSLAFGASFGLLTSLQFLIHGRSNVADMPMVLCIAVSMWAVWELLRPEAPERRFGPWFWTLWLAQGVGFLAKGPITQAVPLLALLLLRFALWRKPLPWRRLQALPGVLVVLVVIGCWGVPALLATQGEFFKVGIGKHVVARGVDEFNQRASMFLYYLPSSLLSLCPWIALAGLAWRVLRRRWNFSNALLAAWFVAPYLIFTPYATRLPHYVMPGFAAFFLVAAQVFDLAPEERKGWPETVFRVLTGLYGVLAVVMLAGAALLPFAPEASAFRGVMVGAGVALLGLALMPVLVLRGRAMWAVYAVPAVMFGLWMLAGGLRTVSSAVQLRPLMASLPEGTRLVGHKFQEPSLVFYSGKPWKMLGDRSDVAAELSRPGPVAVVALEDRIKADVFLKEMLFARLVSGGSWPLFYPGALQADDAEFARGARVSRPVIGFNPARSEWVLLKVYYRP